MENIKIAKSKLRNIMAISIISLLFLLIPLSSAQAAGVNDFKDVKKTDWFYSDIDWALEKNLFKGVSANEFAPNKSITRAEFIVALYRLEGEPNPGDTGVSGIIPGANVGAYNFKDVKKGSWYYKALDWATKADIARGGNQKFGPNDTITREDFATLLHRYVCIYKGYINEGYVIEHSDFIDIAYGNFGYETAIISDWAARGLGWITQEKIMTGRESDLLDPDGIKKGRLDPQGKTTRAEAATIFHRYMEKYGLNN